MCGIAGFNGEGSESDLKRMVMSIRHRGPDYQGVYHRLNIGLAHARLSILDLSSAANQPFFTADKDYAIVFNGEIYNYLGLKSELEKTGKYQFTTTSDTEVLINLYEEHGEAMLQKIHGMFAFAIYDFKQEKLFIARDRMGKKPLYYSIVNNTFVFASELKAILQHPLTDRQLNIDVLNQYLTFDYVPSPGSIFKNIQKLEPAHYLIFKNGKIETKKEYWSVNFDVKPANLKSTINRFDELLNNAVSKRLMSDVPLGVFLSGGLDSSTIAYYAQKNSAQKIKTFSIGFSEKSYDESDYAELVAKHLGTEHYTETLSAKQSLDLLPEIIEKSDEPFADPSIIPTYFLSKITRQKVTVALGGDGSDELLAGYPTFISEKFASVFQAFPKSFIKVMEAMAGKLPASEKNISFDFKVKQFLNGFESQNQYTHSLWLGSFTPADKQRLLTPGALGQITNGSGLSIIDKLLSTAPPAAHLNQLLYIYYKTYLLDDILVKVDRASMYNSLEVRAPFLDTDVIEFLNSLPLDYKMKGFDGKWILKQLMLDKLPAQIVTRPKKGFGIPVSLWLKDELKDLCNNLLSKDKIEKQGLFNYNYVNKLKEEHQSGRRNHRKLLWNLMIFQLWADAFLPGLTIK